MPAPKIFTPENKLAKVLGGIEALPAEKLVAAANTRVGLLRESLRAYVRSKVEIILSFTDASEVDLFTECAAIEDAALGVAEVAGAAGLAAVGEVARGISAMLASLRSRGAWHTEALRVHIASLAIVSQNGGAGSAENDLVNTRLAVMRRAIGIVE